MSDMVFVKDPDDDREVEREVVGNELMSPVDQLRLQKQKLDILGDHVWRAANCGERPSEEFMGWLYCELLRVSQCLVTVEERLSTVMYGVDMGTGGDIGTIMVARGEDGNDYIFKNMNHKGDYR